MNLRENINRKPIEFLSSLVMILAGVYFSSTSITGSATLIIGNVLSALGGALLSWSTVSLTSKEAAAEILNPQLAAIARQLVTISGQISKAVHDSRVGHISEPMAIEMISQASRIMYASVNEIHVVINQKVDAQELLDTAERIEDLATKLAGSNSTGQAEVESELMIAINEFRNKVQTIPTTPLHLDPQRKKNIPKAAPHEVESKTINCPSCDHQAIVEIGLAFGSSAMPTCPACTTRFHAHRAADGSVISKLPGNKQTVKISDTAASRSN